MLKKTSLPTSSVHMSLQMTHKRFYYTQEAAFSAFFFCLSFIFLQTNILNNIKSINKNVKVIIFYLWIPNINWITKDLAVNQHN